MRKLGAVLCRRHELLHDALQKQAATPSSDRQVMAVHSWCNSVRVVQALCADEQRQCSQAAGCRAMTGPAAQVHEQPAGLCSIRASPKYSETVVSALGINLFSNMTCLALLMVLHRREACTACAQCRTIAMYACRISPAATADIPNSHLQLISPCHATMSECAAYMQLVRRGAWIIGWCSCTACCIQCRLKEMEDIICSRCHLLWVWLLHTMCRLNVSRQQHGGGVQQWSLMGCSIASSARAADHYAID